MKDWCSKQIERNSIWRDMKEQINKAKKVVVKKKETGSWVKEYGTIANGKEEKE